MSGWLGRMGFVDFAGTSVVHSVGGWASLAILLVLGPRTGRFPKDGPPKAISGANVPIATLGVILLWLGSRKLTFKKLPRISRYYLGRGGIDLVLKNQVLLFFRPPIRWSDSSSLNL